MSATLAVTGATGFVGRVAIAMAAAQGWSVRALARKAQEPQDGVTWVDGALDQPTSLTELVAGADAVIHLAGATRAANRAAFAEANMIGTAALIDVALTARVSRFIHISSLSAREPQLSDYGWSKAESERVVRNSDLRWSIVRPPAIFGPGDTDHLELFKMAQRGFVLGPPQGTLSVVHVADLARLLLKLAGDESSVGAVYEPDDGRDDWTHASFARAIGAAFSRDITAFCLPKPALKLAAIGDRLVRGSKARLTADRVNYFCHPDWRVDPAKRPPPELWQPSVDTRLGLKTTLAAYREAKWIR